MTSAGINVDPSCVTAFEDIKLRKLNKYGLFKIAVHESDKKERIVIDYQAPKSSTQTEEDERDCYNEFKERLITLNEPRFCVYDFNHLASSGQKVEKLTYIFWCPDSGKLPQKMVYASSNNVVKTAFTGLDKAHQCNDADELSYEEIAERTIKRI